MKKLLWILLLTCFSLKMNAQGALNYLTSTEGGCAYEVHLHADHLYVGAATTLKIYDLTGPNHEPGTLHFQQRFLSNIDYIEVKDDFLYLCVNHDGLYKFDLSSGPTTPVLVDHFVPSGIDESIYDISFYGDSIFAASKTKLNLLLNAPGSISYISTVVSYTGNSRIRGLDIKDSLLAYTVAYSPLAIEDGVYLLNLNDLSQLDFYHDTWGFPMEVYFGQSNELLHVMGGKHKNPFVFDGRYYVLDYSTPTSMSFEYEDTILGIVLLGSVAMPMSAKIINDTIYVSTQGGREDGWEVSDGTPGTNNVYVYDATNPSGVTFLGDIYAGLYHFDTDIDETTRIMYVASEWYGVLTMDVNDIYAEVDLGKTLTGGWCSGSGYANNRLVEASEGYGVRLFDLTDKENPILLAEDTAVGFCRAISISDSAEYVYGWFLTKAGLRVYDGNTLALLGSTMVSPLLKTEFGRSRFRNDKVAVISDDKTIVVGDVSSPTAPVITHYRSKPNLNDLLFHPNGELFALANDSIIVFDPATMTILGSISADLFQSFKAFTLSNDTLWVFHKGMGEGIARFIYNPISHALTLDVSSPYVMDVSSAGAVHMTHDDTLLYISSALDSLKAIRKAIPYEEVGVYNHGADFISDNLWGVKDLYFKDGYLFLNEYFGQTSIFGASSLMTEIEEPTLIQPVNELTVYPNPANHEVFVRTSVE